MYVPNASINYCHFRMCDLLFILETSDLLLRMDEEVKDEFEVELELYFVSKQTIRDTRYVPYRYSE